LPNLVQDRGEGLRAKCFRVARRFLLPEAQRFGIYDAAKQSLPKIVVGVNAREIDEARVFARLSNGFSKKLEPHLCAVSLHSRTGFSGSPVYVYRTFGSDLTRAGGHEFEEIEISNIRSNERMDRMSARGRLRVHNLFNLLGIHWGQFPEAWELKEKSGLSEARQKQLITRGSYVEGMSGMTCVIPAWHIYEALNMPEIKKLRGQAATFPDVPKPKPESAAPRPNDANPNHREDFTRLVGEAARKREQEN